MSHRRASIGQVRLRVADLDQMTGFYQDIIGLRLLEEQDDHRLLGTEDTRMIQLQAAPDSRPRPDAAAGLFHTAIRVPDRSALADVLQRTTGYGLDGAADHGVSEALYLTDPEGNGLEVYRDRPREDWETDTDGHVRMQTRRLDLDQLRSTTAGRATVPSGTEVGHIHLEVTDLDAAERFYTAVLGLDVRQRVRGGLFLAFEGYHHHIGLNTWNHRSAPSSGRGLDSFELILPRDADRGAIVERCREEGHRMEQSDTGVSVHDPDDIQIRLRTGREPPD